MNKKRVLIVRNGQTSYIYFQNWAHHPKIEDLNNFLSLASFQNKCYNINTSQIGNGEVSVCFNPLTHSRTKRREFERSVKQYIESFD